MNNSTPIVPLRAGCSKTDLARAYFPNTPNDETARRNLSRWIRMNPEIVERLAAAGYRTRQHIFTPQQLRIIYDVLGDPGE